MTEAQSTATLREHGATYRTTKGNVQWWWARGGYWIAVTRVGTDVRLQKLPANACGC